jgi:hypothetical protein
LRATPAYYTLSERAAIAARRLRFDATAAVLCASEIAQLACDAPFIRYVVQGPGGLAAFCKSVALTGAGLLAPEAPAAVGDHELGHADARPSTVPHAAAAAGGA